MKIDRFVLAIISIITLAYFFPQLGSKDSNVPLDLIGSIGISLIFFFYGLKLSPEKIKHGLKNWKLHILIQLTTFLLFPILIILFKGFIQGEEGQMLWLSFLFLAALPSTVSSSVVMVSMAKGNIPAAIFNASISGLIGIVITPLWMGLFSKFTATDFNLGEIYIKLLLEILAPVILGILLQKYGQSFVKKYQHQLPLFDKSVILLIIYKSYAHSFEDGVFSTLNLLDLSMVFTAIVILFFAVYFLTGFLSKKLGFSEEDKITAQFCGTKKSLVHGTVFSKILFPSTMPIGLILLPLMLFHALQIFIISIIASKISRRKIATA
ncbi:bile acid:sodium symporter family protein [Aestuariibaculum lutulentum]|uniref:Bile acid:sodium symporter n=1 Tax=Aestuariibaculum lutulentum TaxID=2920935 RepID=A0ABS9RM76_9FLAO|nr:bile acid:sodium symporter family protein [Aestuariibaculum lutulentum]MCH4554061.1 bile acid:sodium symporter [Aestuariibaculum lutulentum]